MYSPRSSTNVSPLRAVSLHSYSWTRNTRARSCPGPSVLVERIPEYDRCARRLRGGPTRSRGDETRRPVVMEGPRQLREPEKQRERQRKRRMRGEGGKKDNRDIRRYSPAALDEICQTTGGSQFVPVRVSATLKEP